ncbi:hypothetical protein F9K81_17740 [Brucella anthropi]|uniref:Uncharacterized protein n=1 Tax=Brucella anthropi TaxID=529 RepID=A0A6I0DSF5_BRUAN|nr:hypothetical protein F9K89_20120 [Brucella anthropi]MCR5939818.1 hypothetical protein [Ochrobactrum sp. XJ1]KAB2756099.1 hypothetical protein F9K81_17740 [Brucella anthropi]KAB2769038.1 hypothetical protein F9K84_12690 [Brucella anthropi]KAB2801145.1 hypothetical protein F9L06_05520 [Brucella anthropi]
MFLHITPSKTASHFCWKCSVFVFSHCPTQNRFALLLEMLHYTNSARDGYSPHSEKSKTALSYQKAFQMKKRRD